MKINNNLFKGNKSGADKGMMLGTATGGVMGAASGGTIGFYVGNEVAKNISPEELAKKMGIPIVEDHVPDVINEKEILKKGGAVFYTKDNVILTIGDNPRGGGTQYVYTFTPDKFFKNNVNVNVNINADDYKDLIKNYSIKGMLVGTLTGTFIGTLVGAFIGVLLGSGEDRGKKG